MAALPIRADPLQLNPGVSIDDLSPYLEYRVDESGRLSISDILALDSAGGWNIAGIDVPNFGFTSDTYWFHLQVNNRHPHDIERFLEVHSALLSEVNIYQVVDGRVVRHYSAGNRVPFELRPVVHAEFCCRYPG